MKRFGFYILLAVLATLPGMAMRLTGVHLVPAMEALLFGVAILGAGFLLSWGAEAAEEHVSQGLAIAGLALVTVLPEYAVDIYYTLQAGKHPGSEYVGFATANMTGANRLLVGVGWPLIVLLFWWRSGHRSIQLRWQNTVEITFLALASLYSFVITIKGRIDLFDTFVLVALFIGYLWRLGKLPKNEDDETEEEPGPAAALTELPKSQQYAVMAALTIFAALAILAAAEPFAESLVATGDSFGINKFLLIQWVAPLAGEAPEMIIVILFTLKMRPTPALGALVSDKINQWTLLVGMIPLFYTFGAGHLAALPLNARQHEEFFLTAAQSLFAVALLLRLRLELKSAAVLLTLFLIQLCLAFAFRNNEALTVLVLTGMAWLYLILALLLFLWNRKGVMNYVRVGLLNQSVPASLREREDSEATEE